MSSAVEEHWPELSALLDELLELPAAARAQWLDERVQDPEQRLLLEDLLRKDDAQGMLDRPGSAYCSLLLDPGESPLPALVSSPSPYRLLQLIGEGGMASVYLAERADGVSASQVAVKLMRVGMLDPYERERFSRERRILARLEHPHIARLLDGGLTAEGVPWIALEYVPGKPITRFCDARRCDIEARLRLFMQVCDTVQFAHQAFVVHRDLKPNNIFVREDGTPKLLDFGIAKLIDDAAAQEDATRTEYRRLTPCYAAPEQFARAPVTTATDVYALGVLLHELLTGTRPMTRADATLRLPSTMFGAETDAPARAAARVDTPRALRKRLAGDLDCIVLKALKRDPVQRYTAAAALRDDIARHLHGDPIHARPDAWGYRAGKFLRRHSFALASVVLVLAVLIGAAVFSLQQARVARDALLRADQHAKDAAAENEFLISTFEGANPFNMKGAPLSAHELLQNTASNIDEEFGDNPRIRAKLHEAIGELFFSFKQISQAQREYEAALAADAAFLPASSPELMEAQITVQIQRLFQGQVDAAVPELQRIERESQLGGDAFLHVHYRARENLASAMTIRGEYAQATQLSESLLEESDQLAAKGMRTYAKYNLSNDYLQQENLTLAMRSIDDLSKNDVASGRLSPGALFHVREIAELLLELGRFNEAREIFARLQPQARKEPDLQSWFFADDLVHEGAALQGLGDETRAHATFAQAFQTFAKAREAFPQVLVDGEYGEALGWIAGGDYAQAGAHLNAILAMYAQMGLPDHPMALAAREALAEIELAHGSRTVRQQLEDVAAHQRPGLDRDLPRTLLTLARIAQSEQDTARTQMLLDETLDVLTRQGRPWHSFAYRAYLQRAALAEQRGEIAAAHAARMHALAAALIDFGEDHARSRAVLAALGAKDAAAGQALLHEARALVSMPPAEALYQRALGTLALVERSPAGSM